LAADSDLVIGVDGGAAICLSAGVLPDLVVGDLDSLDPANATQLRDSGVEFVVFPALKDESDLDLALHQARVRGLSRVVVTGAFSGRLDHTLAAVGSVERAADLWPTIEEPGQRGWVLSASHRHTVRLDPVGACFSVVALAGEATVSIGGAQWVLDEATLATLASLGVGNVITEESASVRVHAGTVLVWMP